MDESCGASFNSGERVAAQAPLDVAIYAGYMDSCADDFLEWCSQSRAEERNCVIILATTGGYAEVAYRIARALQRNFAKTFVAIPWICKSAGTLLCIGASCLLFGEKGELGPLDVQIPQKDELSEYFSGLTPLHALEVLKKQSFNYFEEAFLSILQKGGGQISTTKAARIAIRLTVGLYGQIYEQIDPLQVGQTTMAMKIAKEYGVRLNSVSRNLKRGALDRLLIAYPEHGFVIDGREAEELFKCVAAMPPDISEIASAYSSQIKHGVFDKKGWFKVITGNIQEEAISIPSEEAVENTNLGGEDERHQENEYPETH